MKHQFNILKLFLFIGIISQLIFNNLANAASVSLATSPLVSSSAAVVKPNILFVLDNSGSMAWDYMPDIANNFSGDYGFTSSQCNGVAYDENIDYSTPIKADKTFYSDATFNAALQNGYDTGSGTTDLEGSVYYVYTGNVTDKNYFDNTSAFYQECNTPLATTTGLALKFTKRTLTTKLTTTILVNTTSNGAVVNQIVVNTKNLMSGSATSGGTNTTTFANTIAGRINQNGFSASVSGNVITIIGPGAVASAKTPTISSSGTGSFIINAFPATASTNTTAKLTNYANWYSYYRTRMLMMKTSAGLAFANLGDRYRVGLMKINSSSAPVVEMDTFTGAQRTDWYDKFYATTTNNSTPLREALSNAGLYYSGKLGNATDPVQYSCQQNFTILSTDGYWNGNNGFKLDASSTVGNQDGLEQRPFNDGAILANNFQYQYTRNTYSKLRDNCSGSRRKLYTQPQIGTCTALTSTAGCTPTNWVNSSAGSLGTTCNTTAAPSPSAAVLAAGYPTANTTASGGTSDTLADVAMYYYKTDLRDPALSNCGTAISPATVGPLCENNVFKGAGDNNSQQHMTTFTLGLGANGRMKYTSTYDQDNTGDFFSVKLGLNADSTATPPRCSWQANDTTCNWPTPAADQPENIDDLWHAAVNGRGSYFSATNPKSLSEGLSNALTGINSRRGSAAAAASSTLNPVAGDNKAFIASYTRGEWKGNLEARGINTDTGQVTENALWCVEDIVADSCSGSVVAQTVGDTTISNCEKPAGTAASCESSGGVIGYSGNSTSGTQFCKIPLATSCSGTLSTSRATPMVSATSDTRTIKTSKFDTATSKYVLTDFNAAYALANPTYFNTTTMSGLSQWASLDATQQAAATGTNILNYLRGQFAFEDRAENEISTTVGTVTTVVDNKLFRKRNAVMGDTLESTPTYIGKPLFNYAYPGYSTFKSAQSSRAGSVYIGANDGMMHSFNADTGVERFAYIPSMVIPNLWKLADKDYSTSHINFVNGTPIVTDVCTANCTNATTAVWKTILVGGLNAGGRGYYALDVTNPASPTLLWELTTTAGNGSVKDDDVGYSFGNPIATRKTDGTWVILVASGYNNVSPGTGKGYLYVLNAGTGAIISKIATTAGDTTTPSGLAKIAGWNAEVGGNTVSYVYGGDLLGNVWKFDINATTTAVIGSGTANKFATLFADNAATSPQPITTKPVLGKILGKRVIYIGTGKYLEIADLSNLQKQSMYAILDDDTNITLANPRTSSLMRQQTMTTSTVVGEEDTRVVNSAATVDFSNGRGWFTDFPATGERVNVEPQLILGVVIVPTTVPSSTACSPGGSSFLNFFDYATGASPDGTLVSRQYESQIVGISPLYVDGEPVIQVVTAGDPTPEPCKGGDCLPIKGVAGEFTGKRTLWRELMQ